jgi:uncharacterized protein
VKTLSNWLNILLYFIFFFVCTFLFFIPIFIYFPDLFKETSDNFTNYYDNNLFFQFTNQLATLCGTLLATFLILKVEKKHFSDGKLTIDLVGGLKGFLIGVVIFLTVILVMQVTGAVHFSYTGISVKIIFSLFLYLLVAVGEEIMIRGYILNNLREKMNDYLAVFISSLIFGAIHFFNDHFTLLGFLNITFSGILLGILLVRLNTISAPIGLHWAWNFIQGPIAGFNVSGHKETGVLHIKTLAPDFVTGGDFGAEGSILLIPIVLMVIYIVWKYFKSAPEQVNNQKP